MKKQARLIQFLNTHIPFLSWDYKGYNNPEYKNENGDSYFDLQKDWNQTLLTKINQTAANIFKDSNGGPNVILISPVLQPLLESLEYMKTPKIPTEHLIGELSGRYQVFTLPDLFDQYKIYVCKLVNSESIVLNVLDVKNYIKVGVVKIDNFIKFVS